MRSWGVLMVMMTATGAAHAADDYDKLVRLFNEWRAFEQPAMRDGAPDYTAASLERRLYGDRKSVV